MDKYSVRLLSRALQDLDGIYAYIAETYADCGYRQLLIENYTVIYRIDEAQKQVIVVTVRYSPSNF